MFSPIALLAAADAGVLALLGTPPRFYSFGEAPESVARPYAVWQGGLGGGPDNLLAGRPTEDLHVNQVDTYGLNAKDARAVTRALVRAFELNGYVTSWNGEFRDVETRDFCVSFTVEFITPR